MLNISGFLPTKFLIHAESRQFNQLSVKANKDLILTHLSYLRGRQNVQSDLHLIQHARHFLIKSPRNLSELKHDDS